MIKPLRQSKAIPGYKYILVRNYSIAGRDYDRWTRLYPSLLVFFSDTRTVPDILDHPYMGPPKKQVNNN